MRKTLDHVACGLSAVLLMAFSGCSKSTSDGVPTASTPKQAASQLQEAFVSAPVEVKNDAIVASQALKSADYEKAILSLEAMKARQNLTFEQGMAVHNSMVSLEAKLIAAMEAGDPNAKRAYELLKKSRRD
jgi:hypothetical protein